MNRAEPSLSHGLPLPVGGDILEDEEPVLVVVLLLVGIAEHGHRDVFVLRHRPHAHPDVGALHGRLPLDRVAHHPPAKFGKSTQDWLGAILGKFLNAWVLF